MKNQIIYLAFTIVLIASFSVLTSCNQADKNDNNSEEKTKTTDVNTKVEQDTSSQKEKKKDDPPAKEKKDTLKRDKKDDDLSNNKIGKKVYKLKEIENGDIIEGKTVKNYYYKPHDEFGFELIGDFVIHGKLMKDEMWGEPAIQLSEHSVSDAKISLGGNATPLFKFFYFSNKDDIINSLNSDELKKYNNGEMLDKTMRVKNFSVGGKVDGYGESKVEFVEFTEQ